MNKIPSDLIRYIGSFICDDGEAWSSFSNSCQYVTKTLPNFYDVCMKNPHNFVPLSCFVNRMIYRCSKIGIKLEIITKRTLQNRYININNFIKIDKWSGLILNDQAAMPRGYVIDQNPEIYFSDNVVPRISSVDGARVISNNGYLICIDKMEKRPDFKEKRKKMELYLEKNQAN
jgi:hypothetical protein